MYILEFENSRGVRRKVTSFKPDGRDPIAIAMEYIHVFCEERNFRIYYTRMWNTKENETCFDVGSHTEFFYLTKIE